MAWTPAPDEHDLLPLQSLQHLEVIRWQARALWGDFATPALNLTLTTSRWHPALYAGPRLKIVQHEFLHFVEKPKDYEGFWERSNVNTDGWKIHKAQFFAPRIGFKNEALVRYLGSFRHVQ